MISSSIMRGFFVALGFIAIALGCVTPTLAEYWKQELLMSYGGMGGLTAKEAGEDWGSFSTKPGELGCTLKAPFHSDWICGYDIYADGKKVVHVELSTAYHNFGSSIKHTVICQGPGVNSPKGGFKYGVSDVDPQWKGSLKADISSGNRGPTDPQTNGLLGKCTAMLNIHK